MPLLDHFHPPLTPTRHWESFHSAWASAIADVLNEKLLPEQYFAEENVRRGARVEIDVATFETNEPTLSPIKNGSTATAVKRTWSPPSPNDTIPAVFPESFEVKVFATEGGSSLVAAIEFVSPGKKDRPESRVAFATKCGSYLHQGVSLLIVDIVTSRQANLHNELMALLNLGDEHGMPQGATLYAVGYQPLRRNELEMIDLWKRDLVLGSALPVMPLALNAELHVPIDLETTYADICRRRRLG